MYTYDEDFYSYINSGSQLSAKALIPSLLYLLDNEVNSVLDVGCGAGAWLAVWKEQGVSICGLDGDYVKAEQLLIDSSEFKKADLSKGFSLEGFFDLVQCLEVAEHLPRDSSELLVASLCRHSDMVLFSAAPPGQGGENHINERDYAEWQQLFYEQGYEMYDCIRPMLVGNKKVMPWYRYNTFLYVKKDVEIGHYEKYRGTKISCGVKPDDISPSFYKIRKSIIKLLPLGTQTRLAELKKMINNFKR